MFLSRIQKIPKYLLTILISCFFPIKRKRIVLWSTYGLNYSCNPRALADYLIEHPERGLEVYFAFETGRVSPECKANTLTIGSIEYIIKLNTAEFVLTNHRTSSPRSIYWRKRKCQKYIMTWHGSMPLKMIEKDAIEVLGEDYERGAMADSKNCSLILSDNDWFTETIRRAFWYHGEIFEVGVPRNDVFFDIQKRKTAIAKVKDKYGIQSDTAIVLYAPTFRTDHSLSSYVTDWEDCLDAFKKKLCREVVLFTRLHPGMIGNKTFVLSSNKHKIIDATLYDEMQELLVTADVLITDFSSTMFDFSLINKPCFLVASDLYAYDRKLYFSFESLPYKKYTDVSELAKELPSIDLDRYVVEQKVFVDKSFSPKYDSNTSGNLADWLLQHSI